MAENSTSYAKQYSELTKEEQTDILKLYLTAIKRQISEIERQLSQKDLDEKMRATYRDYLVELLAKVETITRELSLLHSF